jgi:type II secretory pathway pseudopilin PulG
MSNFVIYIRSCGNSPDQDYAWTCSSDNYGKKINPPNILEEINSVIDKESFSVVIKKYQEFFYLLIANVESKNRTDYVNRVVKNTILIRADKNSKNTIDALASLSVISSPIIINLINDSISHFPNELGFTVSLDKINELFLVKNLLLNENKSDTFVAKKTCKKSDNNQQILSEEIKKFGLPPLESFLIILTKNKEEDVLKKSDVWRGMSELCETQNWTIYKTKNSFFLYTVLLISLIILGIGSFLRLNQSQSKAEKYLQAVIKAQEEYLDKNGKFTEKITELDLKEPQNNQDYEYQIQPSRKNNVDIIPPMGIKNITINAIPKKDNLESYNGIIYVVSSKKNHLLCISNKPSKVLPILTFNKKDNSWSCDNSSKPEKI